MKKFLIIISVIVLSVFSFFFSNIKGYYRFKQYCEAEGGLRVYEPLERNVGWLAEDKYDARAAALLDGVGFVRYTDKKDGRVYDIKYVGNNPYEDSSFNVMPMDESIFPVYKWQHISDDVMGEVRLGKYGYAIFDMRNEKILAQYNMFSYSKYDFRHTIFGASSAISCFDENGQSIRELSRWRRELNSAFKD